VWREEAEAQKERADRLAGDLTEIKNRLTRIEQENARLIQLLTSLDPNRLAVMRLAANPTEDD
jgi:predicted nuclease with TOPRIM domain